MNLRSFIRYQLPVFVWMALIFFLSSQTFTHMPAMIPGTDKVVHMTIYAVLCGLLHRAFRMQPNVRLASLSLYLAIGVTLLYGITDEVHQYFVPGRSSDIMDVLADLSGGFIYLVLYMKLKFYETT